MTDLDKYLWIPVITVALTFLATFVKDKLESRIKWKKELNSERLIGLYHKLFILYIEYYKRLDLIDEEEIVDYEEDGCPIKIRQMDIVNMELWHEAFDKVSEVITEKIHLLSYEDLLLWHEFEWDTYREFEREEDILDRYYLFKKFLFKVAETYGDLYHDYHGKSKEIKKERINKVRKQITNTNSNPFYSEEERKKRIKILKRKLKRIRKKGK